jgi:hypothetical protein
MISPKSLAKLGLYSFFPLLTFKPDKILSFTFCFVNVLVQLSEFTNLRVVGTYKFQNFTHCRVSGFSIFT